jgi:hypothetical protein
LAIITDPRSAKVDSSGKIQVLKSGRGAEEKVLKPETLPSDNNKGRIVIKEKEGANRQAFQRGRALAQEGVAGKKEGDDE